MKKRHQVLVIDGSRVVRATLNKHLKDEFEVCEEDNGESAWQTLVLNANVHVLISGLHTPKLEAYDLLARLRASSIKRLQKIPVVLIVSDIDSQAERDADRARGVAGFITKSMKQPLIVDCVHAALNLAKDRSDEVQPAAVPDLADKPQNTAGAGARPAADLDRLLPDEKFRPVIAEISFCNPVADDVCALAFGIDNHESLLNNFGPEVSEMVATRFAALLAAKVGPLDLLGRCRDGRLAIISHGVDLKQGVRFGQQVCKSLASGQITIRGQKIKLTASVGVASTSQDEAKNGSELLALADDRLDQALTCGGNNVATEYKPDCPVHCAESIASKFMEVVNAQSEDSVAANIGTLGLNILPILEVMNRELALGLSIDEIKKQLEKRLSAESAKQA